MWLVGFKPKHFLNCRCCRYKLKGWNYIEEEAMRASSVHIGGTSDGVTGSK